MATRTFCDGCDRELTGFDHVIHGERVNGSSGGGIPARAFDWCLPCAQAAFRFLSERRPAP